VTSVAGSNMLGTIAEWHRTSTINYLGRMGMTTTPAIGQFTCDVTLQVIRAPAFGREERDGVTYLVGRDYELAYETTLRFANGDELSIRAMLIGELNQQVVIRDSRGAPARVSGYVQGQTVISDVHGAVLFRGRYYDSRVVQSLSGDDALTPVGQRVVDHLENGFGEGQYAGHAFSLGIRLVREGTAPLAGPGHGQID